MCFLHWKKVPTEIQKLVWKYYRPGQEVDKRPSQEYLLVQRTAIWAVFVSMGGCRITEVPEVGSDAYMIGPSVFSTGGGVAPL